MIAAILAAAERFADRPALEEANGEVATYRELVARARGFASRCERGTVVELAAVRSADLVASCLGAWLAGAAWTPVDPCEPEVRRLAIRERLASVSSVRPPDDLAYVIATSGSSGTPKAVMVSHRGLRALVDAQIAAFQLEPGARSLWLHAPVFDASISDWGTALASGATLVVPSPTALASPSVLHAELERRAITHVDLPPSLLGYLDPLPSRLRVVVLGGEPCPVERVRSLARRVRVVVVYGPTEATVCSSLVAVDPERWTRPLVGEPLSGVRYRVVDGELWIAGDCLALGYAGDPDETARRFVELDGERMYRTGDRVEAVEGGLAFLGRIDRQRKLAGRRVELEEIESVLRHAPGVRDAAACIRAVDANPRERLVGFVEGAVTPGSVRDWMRREVPAWMVPARVVVGPLPRTASGKIDLAVLARCRIHRGRPPELRGLAAEVSALWCNALGLDEARPDERFRDAGGDSLAALALHAAAAARAIPLDPAILSTDPTFAELLASIENASPPAGLSVRECEARGLARRWPRAAGSTCVRPTARDRVLVTGATGLLGRELVQAWRRRDARGVIALVRGADDDAARRRLALAGVEVICGDVALPFLGLSQARWSELAGRVSSVIHAAAAIELSADWDAHAAANVGGTAELERFVDAGDPIAWHHISTLSVFVGTDRAAGRHLETDDPDPSAIAFGGYAQTKLAAEAIARARSRDRSAPTTIMRLGLLATTRRAGDQLGMTIRGLARLGAVPLGGAELRFDVTPVDHAAVAIAGLALHAERAGRGDTHHIASSRGASFSDLVASMRHLGVPLEELAPDAWADRARARLTDPDVAMAFLSLGRMHADRGPRFAPFDLFLATNADFAVERTAHVLADLAIEPPPIDLAAIAAGALREGA